MVSGQAETARRQELKLRRAAMKAALQAATAPEGIVFFSSERATAELEPPCDGDLSTRSVSGATSPESGDEPAMACLHSNLVTEA